MSNKQYISFFDLDKTLLSVNSSFKFGSYLYQRGIFSFLTMTRLVVCYGLHKAGFLSIPQLHHYIFKKIFKGTSYKTMHDNAIEFLNYHFEKIVYHPACERLKDAQHQGHHTVILSSGPDFLVGLIAKKLSVEHWQSSNYCLDNEHRFSHISRLIQGNEKAQCVADYARLFGVPNGNLIAYTDSYLDLPFLESVGKCIGVNPDRRLRRICKRNRWEII